MPYKMFLRLFNDTVSTAKCYIAFGMIEDIYKWQAVKDMEVNLFQVPVSEFDWRDCEIHIYLGKDSCQAALRLAYKIYLF
jgi:hypothetical protein